MDAALEPPAAAGPDAAAPDPAGTPAGTTVDTAAGWLPLLLAALVCCGAVWGFAAPRSEAFLTRQGELSALFADVDRGLVDAIYRDGNEVVWRPAGAWTWSAADLHGQSDRLRPIDDVEDVLAEAAEVNRDAHLEVRSQGWTWGALQAAGVIGGLAAFLLLVAGPPPRRANRWAWFWILYIGQPYGLGVLAFLLLGAAPVRTRVDPGRHRAEPRERVDGRTGFGIALLAGLLLVIPGVLVHDALIGSRHPSTYTYDTPDRLR
jgi:hypothetical protein